MRLERLTIEPRDLVMRHEVGTEVEEVHKHSVFITVKRENDRLYVPQFCETEISARYTAVDLSCYYRSP